MKLTAALGILTAISSGPLALAQNEAAATPPAAETAAADAAPADSGSALDKPVTSAEGSGEAPDGEPVELQQAREAEEMQEASSPMVRRFHEVLDELLAEFGYDVKMGQVNGLKNLSIRKVTVSDTLPWSYRSYVELLVAERIRENSQIRLVSCLPCRSKTTRLMDGRLVVTSPTTNMAEMQRASDQLGIDYFMDIVLVFHTTHMVLAMQAFNTQSKELVWARTYNSETVRSRYQKLAVDYSQVEKSRPGEEYEADFRYLAGMGAASVPNVGGTQDDSGFILLHFRGSERFNNRQNEFGMILNIYSSSSALLSDYPSTAATDPDAADEAEESVTTSSTPDPFTQAIGVYGIYAQNFIGALESYNEVRHGATVGVGFLMASGYIAGTGRLGWDTYFGRNFSITGGLLYVMSSRILVDNQYRDTQGGAGGEIAVAYNF